MSLAVIFAHFWLISVNNVQHLDSTHWFPFHFFIFQKYQLHENKHRIQLKNHWQIILSLKSSHKIRGLYIYLLNHLWDMTYERLQYVTVIQVVNICCTHETYEVKSCTTTEGIKSVCKKVSSIMLLCNCSTCIIKITSLNVNRCLHPHCG